MDIQTIKLKKTILEDNDKDAELLRSQLDDVKTFYVNVMSSPGSGKTTTLISTIRHLQNPSDGAAPLKVGVMEADIDSDVDAQTISRETGVPSVQLHTGGMCHLDAEMSRQGLRGIGYEDLDLVFLENVGNLVCPAEFDTGAHMKAVILSVPEGDDKPLKYPLMFQVSDCLLINKIDTKAIFDFDEEVCAERVHKLNPKMQIFPLSSKTGEGFDAWINWLKQEIEAWRK